VTTGDDEGPAGVPQARVPERTLVIDAGSGRLLLQIDGMVTLPVGARVELAEPRSDAIVTGIRLRGTVLVLDVMLVQVGDLTDMP
jgi:hypothetical protein